MVTVKTSTCAPVIVAARLRKGSAGSGRGAASRLREALATVRAMGITAQIIVRADSVYFSHKVVDACRTAGVRFSLAVTVKKTIREAIGNIAEDAWAPIEYTDAIWDDEEGRWVSDAELARSPSLRSHTMARLIVRRVKRLNPKNVPEGQAELFGVWRYHVIFTDRRFTLGQVEPVHRGHVVSNRPSPSRGLHARPSALGEVHRARHLVGSGRHLQPHSRQRPSRLCLPRQGTDRNHPGSGNSAAPG
ncbi:transposase [Streptomyces sp. NPDC059142]|uniref:transposase n=1 Tax=Streptomyces sp. NPDC059142 TaxID=3346739 RepID=UPI00367462CC